jgi:glycosyltransferase involved in cell wall biosynthesis
MTNNGLVSTFLLTCNPSRLTMQQVSKTPLISIIMAAKDTAPYLEECLDSIIAQTYPHWELIAVNDHSTDSTPDILEAYAARDSRIKVFQSKRQKLIPTLKEGYPHIKGELINRMDSDDKMPDYKLQIMLETWLEHGKGTIVAGGTQHFVDEGEVGGGFLRYDRWLNSLARTNSHYEQIYRECVIPSHCWLIHRDDFEKVGGFEPEIYPEDYDLCFRFYQAGLKVVGIDKVLHFWRDRSERISRTWEQYKDNRYFELKLRYFLQIDREAPRPLVLWGAGRNGKDLARLLLASHQTFHWVCDNPNKIGKDVYGIRMEHFEMIRGLENPQIITVVASPEGREEIAYTLGKWGKYPVQDYWFFL